MTPATPPLHGLRVVELAGGLCGAMCAMLLADLGADVVRLESAASAGVDPNGPEYAAFNRNKRSVAIDFADASGRAAARHLALGADIFIESLPHGEAALLGLGCDDLRAARARLVYCSVSSFGRTGPCRKHPGGELVVQALTGAMDITGEPGRPPIAMGLPMSEEIAGALAAITALAYARPGGAAGASVDIAAFDAGLAMLSYMATIYFATGRSSQRLGSAHPTIAPYSAFKSLDGYIVVAPFTQGFWRKFCTVIGREDLPADPRFRSFGERLKHRDALAAILAPILAGRTTAQWLDALERGDVPAGPVHSVAEALDMPQTRARGMIAQATGADGRVMRVLGTPFHFTRQDGSQFVPRYTVPPAPGQDAPPSWSPPPAAGEPGDGAGQRGAPLAGMRVIDLTRMFAGPYCGQLLADLGAEVIKVEEPGTGDPTRRNVPMIESESTYFMAVNRGKKSVAIDLKAPAGRALLLDLVRTADVLVENFRPGVMDRLGLSYDELKRVRPGIVMLSISGFGHTGPMRERISFDLVNQAMAGTMGITGEPGRPPVRIGFPAGDLNGGIFGTLAVVAALHARGRDGQGAWIDLSLHDLMVSLLGPHAHRYLTTGVCPQPMGSSHPDVVPHRAYEANDGWLVLAAPTQTAWEALVRVVGRPEWTADARFANASSRVAHREELDALLASELLQRPVAHWVQVLDAAGVPCARVCTMGEALDCAQARERGAVIDVRHPVAGACRAVSTALVANGRPLIGALPSPTLGQHTAEILAALGYETERIDALMEEGVVATQAAAAN